jgi:diguanylate cyclase (GGDEF)-like protein
VWLLAAPCPLCPQTLPIPLPDHARYAIEHFGERFGLGASTVFSLAQDRQGFLWIGTQTGVVRYDGAGVKKFGRESGLPGQVVEMVQAAADGHVWVRTRTGIAKFEHERFSSIPLPDSRASLRDIYQSFAVDSQGTVYIATGNGILSENLYGKTTNLYSSDAGHPVEAVVRGLDDKIWFAAGKNLSVFTPAAGKTELISILPGNDPVYALLPTCDGKIWIRTTHNLGLLDLRRAEAKPLWIGGDLPGTNGMGGPSLDRHGDLLLPTYRGLYQRTGNQWKIINRQNGLTSNAVASALEDRDGGIWIGSAGAGLDYWPGSKQWSGWTDAEGLPDALVLGVARDSLSRLWVATNTSLVVWDPATRKWNPWTSNGLAGAGVRQILRAPDGAMWALIPTKGLFRFDASSAHPKAQRVPTTASWQPRQISMGPDGAVWADGVNQLHSIRYSNKRFEINELAVPLEVLGSTSATSVSPDGVLWTAGPDGLSRHAKDQWQHFTSADGLLSNNIASVRALAGNEAWVGYPDEGAVTRLRVLSTGISVRHFPSAMCTLEKDAHNRVWLEMQEGAGVVSSDDHVSIFTQNDGLLWNDLNCDAMWQEADGSILLGTSKGLARYDPGQQFKALPHPTVVITSAQLGKRERVNDDAPSVSYADRTFHAEFAAPVFHDPDHVTCRYRLNGLESDFTETTLREARYPSLPAGAYSFEVSCGSSQLGWSQTAGYPFLIRAPWWESRWTHLAGLTLIAFLIAGIFRYRTRRMVQEREKLELAVAERSAELAKANQELQEVSLRDPLTGIRNRRFFETTIAADASQAVRAYRTEQAGYSRDHRDLVFYLIDIDHFKEINDRHGHQAGDVLLVEIAQRLNRIVRESDYLIRWGGEEFLAICRSADRDEAHHMAERILQAVGSTEFTLGTAGTVHRTCSIGWAPFPWMSSFQTEMPLQEVLRLADHALYLSKQRGRNQATGMLPAKNRPRQPYTKLEELLEEGGLREVRTTGPAIDEATLKAHV